MPSDILEREAPEESGAIGKRYSDATWLLVAPSAPAVSSRHLCL